MVAVIPAIAGDGQKINKPICDGVEPLRKLRNGRGELAQDTSLETRVIRDGCRATGNEFNQCLGATLSWILAVDAQEFVVGNRPVGLFKVKRELERDLLVWPCSNPARHCKSYGLEIQPCTRIFPLVHRLPSGIQIMERLAAARCCHDSGISRSEIRPIKCKQIRNPFLFPSLSCAIRQERNWPVGGVFVSDMAVAREFARERAAAMVTDVNHRFFACKHSSDFGDQFAATGSEFLELVKKLTVTKEASIVANGMEHEFPVNMTD
ncbi:hypothetical protein MPL3365_30305 [Mesorhizobium plurifarium]|uniref:Uncharacterized protein n=1 Tax=Mesorhizobium plurifarium TaxID=69974 RepID=A0A090G7W4_MESPL|nr:hypothetical protein MPL3365_30305 [Mesorhizobium plurifarium]